MVCLNRCLVILTNLSTSVSKKQRRVLETHCGALRSPRVLGQVFGALGALALTASVVGFVRRRRGDVRFVGIQVRRHGNWRLRCEEAVRSTMRGWKSVLFLSAYQCRSLSRNSAPCCFLFSFFQINIFYIWLVYKTFFRNNATFIFFCRFSMSFNYIDRFDFYFF